MNKVIKDKELSNKLSEDVIEMEKMLNEYLQFSKNRSSDLIQALMDYGSKICLPRVPKCNICVINHKIIYH